MAHTILVADGIDQSSEITNYLTRFPPVVFDRMALIASIHRFQGVGTTETQYLTKALHKRTHTMYNTHWRNWAEWCLKKSPPVNPLAHNPHPLLQHLVSLRSKSLGHLNALRCGVTSVLDLAYPDPPSLSKHILIRQFFKSQRHAKPVMPSTMQEEYSLKPELDLISSWGKTNELTIE
jgi:hypothetical protein